jgi:pyruvate dehydrogenase E2 component (dihydrolipoamide acetyltransferase)
LADVLMPRLSDSMEEGTILRWLKQDGEPIARGEAIVEIETDVATMTYEAYEEGTLQIVAADRETLAIGTLIARIAAPAVVATAPIGVGAAISAAAPPVDTGTAKGQARHIELTRPQGTLARRMAESKATVPDYGMLMRIDMQAVTALRASARQAGTTGAPTVNDYLIRACGLALRAFPKVNGAYRDGRFELYSRVNVGVAVATDESIVVPTIFDADRKTPEAIAQEMVTLAARAREGKITPPELAGGTFTMSNLGMYGVDEFTAVINPPQAALLTAGAIVRTPVAVGDVVEIRPIMAVGLICDHRILTGVDAARFLGHVRTLLEDPAQLAG